jgi:hypothetical protein
VKYFYELKFLVKIFLIWTQLKTGKMLNIRVCDHIRVRACICVCARAGAYALTCKCICFNVIETSFVAQTSALVDEILALEKLMKMQE